MRGITHHMSSQPKRQLSTPSAGAAQEGLGHDPTGEAFLAMLGQRVRTARAEQGLSRKALAELADVSERYLAQLESGEGNASSILLRRVGRALGLRVSDLLSCDQSDELQRIRRFLDGVAHDRLGAVLEHLVRHFGAEPGVRRKRIALIGLRGAGKSTLGAALAKEMRRTFVELDREIELEAGMELSEIFLLYGQPGFRRLERTCLKRTIDSQRDVVISIGGGAVSDPQTLQLLLASCFTVWLKASPAEHMARVLAQGDTRPMKGRAQAMQDLKEILSSREPHYARADITVDTSGKSIEKSLAALRRACAPQAT